jgi:hypothetical protein
MKKIIINIFLVLLLTCPALYSQAPKLKTNFELLDSLVSLYAGNFFEIIKSTPQGKICLKFNDHPAKWLFTNKILEKNAGRYTFLTKDTNVADCPKIEISINDLSVKYLNEPESSDSLIRISNIKVSGSVETSGKLETLPVFSKTVKDTISRNDIEYVKSVQHDFANSPVPEPKKTLFEDIIQPLIIITTAAVSILLLFTVRSN